MNVLLKGYEIWRLSRKFSDYQPLRVNPSSIKRWLSQYSKSDHKLLIKLLKCVIYYSEEDVEAFLQRKNEKLLSKLNADGIPDEKVIYVTIDETASSSHVMLNKLRDAGRLERKGCKFIDSQDLLGLNKVVSELGSGAIVYVDDFVGTGSQFCESRDHIARNIQTVSSNFSEFFLAPCICQEAVGRLSKRGVVPFTDRIHTPSERILHPDNIDQYLTQEEKDQLVELSSQISRRGSLGFENLATMVVIYSNTPNTTPLILRGNIGQDKFVGIIPRTTDLSAS